MSEIIFYNRYTQREEVEEIYGESFLRWTYETTMGRIGLWLLAKRAIFSHWYGWRMNKPASRSKVQPFLDTYGLETDEFVELADSYLSFNDFFYRKLKSEARPVVEGTNSIALPADGRHLGIENVSKANGFYVKGQRFDLSEFLGDNALGEKFAEGTMTISRLCPVDYHRFHSPVGGRIVEQRLINGCLASVSPIALRPRVDYLWENKRLLTIIESEELGTVAFVAIGATCVGSILMTAESGTTVAKGDELGYFAFGGSCVVSIFQKGKIRLAPDLMKWGSECVEVYAKVGDALGTIC